MRKCRLDWCLSRKFYWFWWVLWIWIYRDEWWEATRESTHCRNRLLGLNWLTLGRKFRFSLLSIDWHSRIFEHAGNKWTIYSHSTMPIATTRYNRLKSCILPSLTTEPFIQCFTDDSRKFFGKLYKIIDINQTTWCFKLNYYRAIEKRTIIEFKYDFFY